jgi:hypothetical protein
VAQASLPVHALRQAGTPVTTNTSCLSRKLFLVPLPSPSAQRTSCLQSQRGSFRRPENLGEQ